jgi:hypothetical protein
VTLSATNGNWWLAVHADLSTPVSGWTRRSGSHFLVQQAATQPANPSGGLVFAQLTVASLVITAVTPLLPVTSPPMSRQNSHAVAITDGRISLGGHAPTGVLDVQGSVVASDVANQYFAARVWPSAPSGATFSAGVRIEPVTGAAAATAGFRGLVVRDQPVSTGSVYGLALEIAAGSGRYNLQASGTAPNYLAGTVEVASTLGFGTAPVSNVRAKLLSASGMYGLWIQAAAGGTQSPILFVNSAAVGVGSITHNDTSTAYNTTSDARLKSSITPLTDALTTLLALRPVAFKWNSTDEPDEGFLAHELQQHIPHAVTGEPDQVHDDGSIKPQQVDHSKLVVWLVGAVQTLAAKVQAMEEALGV